MPNFLATPLRILLTGLSAVGILFSARLTGIDPGSLLDASGRLAALRESHTDPIPLLAEVTP